MTLSDRIAALTTRIAQEINAIRTRFGIRSTLTSDATGTVTWLFPTAFSAAPVLTAIPEVGTRPYLVNVVSVTTTQATFRIYRLRTVTATLNAVLDGIEIASGVTLHCTARP